MTLLAGLRLQKLYLLSMMRCELVKPITDAQRIALASTNYGVKRMTKNCRQCGSIFEYHQRGCHPRYLCDACRLYNRKELTRKNNNSPKTGEAKRRWQNSLRGKEMRSRAANIPKRKEAKRIYRQSPEGKKTERKYWQSQKFLDTRRRFLSSGKGRVYLANMRIRWRGSDYGEYLAFKSEAFRDKLPCVKCGKSWIDGTRGVTHEIDHILSRRLGGTHRRDNLQVLCFECHLAKTKLDREGMKCLA